MVTVNQLVDRILTLESLLKFDVPPPPHWSPASWRVYNLLKRAKSEDRAPSTRQVQYAMSYPEVPDYEGQNFQRSFNACIRRARNSLEIEGKEQIRFIKGYGYILEDYDWIKTNE
jgi:hypothetical protein